MAYKSIDLCVLLSGVTFILTLISISLYHCIMHSQCHLSATLKLSVFCCCQVLQIHSAACNSKYQFQSLFVHTHTLHLK